MHERTETWTDENPDGRWRAYDYDDLLRRERLSLDVFWTNDKSLADTDSLPAPDVIAAEIAYDLEPAQAHFTKIVERLSRGPS